MKALAEYVHAKGLKFGMYSCVGTQTCAGYPGSYANEELDAQTLAEWGRDFLKYDYCYKPAGADGKALCRRMGQAEAWMKTLHPRGASRRDTALMGPNRRCEAQFTLLHARIAPQMTQRARSEARSTRKSVVSVPWGRGYGSGRRWQGRTDPFSETSPDVLGAENALMHTGALTACAGDHRTRATTCARGSLQHPLEPVSAARGGHWGTPWTDPRTSPPCARTFAVRSPHALPAP